MKRENCNRQTYRAELRINRDMLLNPIYNDEFFYRQLAKKIVSEIPIDALMNLIDFSKIDPESDEWKMKFYDPLFATHEKEKWFNLKQTNEVLYKAETIKI